MCAFNGMENQVLLSAYSRNVLPHIAGGVFTANLVNPTTTTLSSAAIFRIE